MSYLSFGYMLLTERMIHLQSGNNEIEIKHIESEVFQ